MATSRLGEMLVREGKLSPAQLQRALQVQQLAGGRLGGHLLELGLIGESVLLEALGRLRASSTIGPGELDGIKPAILKALPAKLALRYRVLPYQVKGKTLFIASSDPGDVLREDEIAFMTSFMVRTALALEFRLGLALARHYQAPVDPRWVALARRFDNVGEASAVPPPPSLPAAPPAPARPVFVAPAPKSEAPRPAAPPPPAAAPAAEPTLQFIELDAEDAALLRRPAASADRPDPLAAAVEAGVATVVMPLPRLAPIEPAPVEPVSAGAEESGEVDFDALYDDSLDARLDRAAQALQEAEIRDDIGDVLLGFTGLYYRRRALLIARKERLVGWRAEGEGVEEKAIRALDLDAKAPSVLLGLREADTMWLGPLPALPSNQALVEALGGPAKDCLVLPVVVRGKVVCHLYADNLSEGVAGGPVAAIRRLVGKAGLAFEVYILRNKIRWG